MIKLKLHSIAKKLGKNISEISEETGINRNTITALFHGSANGVWFSTLDRLCNRYNLELTDIVEFEPDAEEAETPKMYRQILSATPMEFWARISAIQKPNPRFFDEGLGSCDIYFHNNNCEVFWHTTAGFQEMATAVYKEYGPMERRFYDLRNAFFEAGKKIDNLYIEKFGLLDKNMSLSDLLDYFGELRNGWQKFWSLAIFLDSFDVGFDNKEVMRIAGIYGFSTSEVGSLLTAEDLSWEKQRRYELFILLKKIEIAIKKNKKTVKDYLANLIKKDEKIKIHIAKYPYYGKSLVEKNKNFIGEVEQYFFDVKKWQTEYKDLKNYTKKQKLHHDKILRQYKITSNPLAFFVEMGRWKEYRNLVNTKAGHLLHDFLNLLAQKIQIDISLLNYLSFDEVDNVIRNLTSKNILQERIDYGMIVSMLGADYKVIEGEEVAKVYQELKEILGQSDLGRALAGKVGSPGYAQGMARVVINDKDMANFKAGEILVTTMTNDKMIEIIKQAGAIVCDEGGMDSHGAIQARLLGKPCIVGTGIATKQIHTGDIVAVRAHHGTVRVLEANK